MDGTTEYQTSDTKRMYISYVDVRFCVISPWSYHLAEKVGKNGENKTTNHDMSQRKNHRACTTQFSLTTAFGGMFFSFTAHRLVRCHRCRLILHGLFALFFIHPRGFPSPDQFLNTQRHVRTLRWTLFLFLFGTLFPI